MFEDAYYGKVYLCRNNTKAYYCRYSESEKKHCLMVNDRENDFILCFDDGHVFHVEEMDDCTFKGKKNEGKTIYEVYGWNRDEMKDFRLDIVSENMDFSDEQKLRKFAEDCCPYCTECYDCGECTLCDITQR